MNQKKEFYGPNFAYILELYQKYQANPNAVNEESRRLFQSWSPLDDDTASPVAASFPTVNLTAVSGAVNLARSIRSYGYLSANLNPLESEQTENPLVSLDFHKLTQADLASLPASLLNISGAQAENALEAIEILRSIYSGSIGYDYAHVRIPEERDWLYHNAESGAYRQQTIDKKKLLERLSQVEAFELFLHRIYPGKTRFSVEGLDMLIPLLDEIVDASAREKIPSVLIGMAHRGRLNVLAHILHKPYTQILAEFADPKGRATTWDELGWTGDVKYHMGAQKKVGDDKESYTTIHMPANPSHLEQIDPVLVGMARAINTKVERGGAPAYENASLPVLIHGDASFAGQGIVAETLNFSRVHGYTTSGTLHIVSNNQLGFTANEEESRSSLHASDLAEGFEIPVIHVNADDPLACLEAVKTAFAYRQKFHKDFVVNLIGYRRYGHNEGDEPRFTQPVMYRKIDKHPSVRKIWAGKLESENLIQQGEAEEMLQGFLKNLQQASEQLDAEKALVEPLPHPPPRGAAQKVKTSVTQKRLKELNRSLFQFPENFHLNSKLVKATEKRKTLFDDPRARIDWAAAEELAYASILEDGIAIRLTGQDSARGTFSQRHAVFYDSETGTPYTPLQALPQAKAAFEVLNSPLSEAGAIGFEIGYSLAAPERLVIWEAQYGDFVNNAQSVIDEFLLSSRAKWGLTPSLVLLLPHGNEGQGPDHSSARIERFLGLAAETNVRIAYPSTAAQYFHLLRRQALLLKTDPLPLIVFTPKGLLRHPLTTSPAEELSAGGWQRVLDDSSLPGERSDVRNLILCSGRIYVDLVNSELRKENPDDAIVRVEQLYPFPAKQLQDLLDEYPNVERLIWVQEEPFNMGAWNYLRPLLRGLTDGKLPVHYVGRPESSSPSEGSTTLYRINQQSLIEQAFAIEKQLQTSSVVKTRG
ncbi:MAG: 2-oxoglutarate dehydrogenase E1 component [Anaerolineales bacterium]|nr:2-oxoglutarate dehydrogenase E1 component [Anaerolineales bacterium]